MRKLLLCILVLLMCLTACAELAIDPDEPAPTADSNVPLPSIVDRRISEKLLELWQSNPEVIGWIEMGKDVATPVVYRDNSFYLNHDINGNPSQDGTVFADVRNLNWETDPYVLLYGHNMRSGRIFGYVDQYQYLDYFKENARVEFFSAYNDEVFQYVPFAVVDGSMDQDHPAYFKVRSFSAYKTPETAEAFLQEIQARTLIEVPGLEVSIDDRIIGMITCSYKVPNGRITVFCRALREGETMDEMLEYVWENARNAEITETSLTE